MRKAVSIFFLKFAICIAFFSFALYSYLEEQNTCTGLGMHLPKVVKEIEVLEQENAQLRYQIVTFESPDHLLTLSKEPYHAHLKFPFFQDVLQVKEGLALQFSDEQESLQPSAPRSSSRRR